MAGNPYLDAAMIATARYLILVIPVSLVVAWLAGYRRVAFFVFVTTVAAIAIAQLLGQGYYHDPPHLQGYETLLENDPENAFPSNHASAIFGFAFGVASMAARRLGLLAFAIAALIGFSRIYTGLHFPIDILGGVVAGGLALLVVYAIRDYIDMVFGYIRKIEDGVLDRVWPS